MLESKVIKVPVGTRIVVVGDIHEHKKQFNQMIHHYNFRDDLWLVSVGDVYDKGAGPDTAEYITEQLADLQSKGHCFAVRGNHELKVIKKSRNLTKALRWWSQQPLAHVFQFYNNTRVVVVHAGIEPHTTFERLGTSVDVCYVREVDSGGRMIPLKWETDSKGNKILRKASEGVPWHDVYDGRFGYVVSGHNARPEGAKLYNYSCNIDSAVYETGNLTTVLFNEKGSIDSLKVFEGEALDPDVRYKIYGTTNK